MANPIFIHERAGGATASTERLEAGRWVQDEGTGAIRVHNGSTAGGIQLARADLVNVGDPNFSGSTGGLSLPAGTTAQRPATTRAGQFRWNTNTSTLEVATNNTGSWATVQLTGASIGTAGINLPIGLTTQRPTGTQTGVLRWNSTDNRPEVATETAGVWTYVLTARDTIMASHATTAGSATSATTAGHATTAGSATSAERANTAGRADSARNADNAGSADSANTALRATAADGGFGDSAFRATRGPSSRRPAGTSDWYGSTRQNTTTNRYEVMDNTGVYRNVLYESASFTAPRATLADGAHGVAGFKIPTGTQAQRSATPTVGLIRFNSTTNRPEVYTGSPPAWKAMLVEGDAASAGAAVTPGNDVTSIAVGTSAQRPSTTRLGDFRYNTSENYPEIAVTTNGAFARVILSGVTVDAAERAGGGTGTGAFVLTRGTTAQRPSGITGGIRYNATTGRSELSDSGGTWRNIVYEGIAYTAPNATRAEDSDRADLATRATNADNAGHASTASGGRGTGAFRLPSGTSTQRPTSTRPGDFRWNTAGYLEVAETTNGGWARVHVSGDLVGRATNATHAAGTTVHTFPTVSGNAGDLLVVNAARNGFNLVPQSNIVGSSSGGGASDAAVENITEDIAQPNNTVQTGTRGVDLVRNHTRDLGRLRNFVVRCEAVTTGTHTMQLQTATNGSDWVDRPLTHVFNARYIRCVITTRSTSVNPVITSSNMTIVFTTQREQFPSVNLANLGGTISSRIAPLQGNYNSITLIEGHPANRHFTLRQADAQTPPTPHIARILATDDRTWGKVPVDTTINSLVVEGLPRMSAAANGNITLG